MKKVLGTKKVSVNELNSQKYHSDALRIVREFQREYRETIPHKPTERYEWTANPPSVTEGALKQKNYAQDSQSI